MSKINMEIDENTLKKIIYNYLEEKLGDVSFSSDDIKIETKSAQNYRSEWETAHFKATIEVSL